MSSKHIYNLTGVYPWKQPKSFWEHTHIFSDKLASDSHRSTLASNPPPPLQPSASKRRKKEHEDIEQPAQSHGYNLRKRKPKKKEQSPLPTPTAVTELSKPNLTEDLLSLHATSPQPMAMDADGEADEAEDEDEDEEPETTTNSHSHSNSMSVSQPVAASASLQDSGAHDESEKESEKESESKRKREHKRRKKKKKKKKKKRGASSSGSYSKNALECSICKHTTKNAVDVVCRLTCGHSFHADCIGPWCGIGGKCPICKKVLSDADKKVIDEHTVDVAKPKKKEPEKKEEKVVNGFFDESFANMRSGVVCSLLNTCFCSVCMRTLTSKPSP